MIRYFIRLFCYLFSNQKQIFYKIKYLFDNYYNFLFLLPFFYYYLLIYYNMLYTSLLEQYFEAILQVFLLLNLMVFNIFKK